MLSLSAPLRGTFGGTQIRHTTTHTVVSTHPGAPEGITASQTPQRGRWTAAGSVIIDWQNRSLIPIDGNLDAVIDHWAWTHDPQAHTSTMIDLGTGTTTTSPVTATPARPLGIAQNHLIVLSDDDQGRLNLYALNQHS